MGLDTTNPANPLGSDNVANGDNEIRTFKQDTIDSVQLEHSLTGEHYVRSGTAGQRPSGVVSAQPITGNPRSQIFINTSGAYPIFEYFDGTSWSVLTDLAKLNNHVNSTDLTGADGHVNASVKTATIADASITGAKLGAGSVLKAKITGGDAAALVDGSNSSALHIHDINDLTDSSGLLSVSGIGTTFTPTATTDVGTVSSVGESWYLNLGTTVIVAGTVTINFATSVFTAVCTVSLPIISDLQSSDSCVGTFTNDGGSNPLNEIFPAVGQVLADAIGNRATFSVNATGGTGNAGTAIINYNYSYTIV